QPSFTQQIADMCSGLLLEQALKSAGAQMYFKGKLTDRMSQSQFNQSQGCTHTPVPNFNCWRAWTCHAARRPSSAWKCWFCRIGPAGMDAGVDHGHIPLAISGAIGQIPAPEALGTVWLAQMFPRPGVELPRVSAH